MAEFRSKLSTAFSSFFAHLTALQGTSGNGSAIPIRKVGEGEASPSSYPVPFLVVQLISGKVDAQADADKVWASKIKLRIVSQVSVSGGVTSEILAKIAQVEDKIDAYSKPDGVTGYLDAEWSITYGTDSGVGNLIIADCLRSFSVAVAKGAN